MPPDRERDPETGQVKPKDPTPILNVFDDRSAPCEPLTATEIADALDWPRRTASKKLNEVADDGRLAARKVGGRAKVYWPPADDE